MPKAILEAGHAACPLIDAIVALGEAVDWQEARKEWELAEVFFAERDQPGTCLCGHAPIIEHCVLLNRKNGNRAVVGNVCVKRFMGLPSGKLFEAFARIMAKRDAALNAATVEYAHGKGWINNWERGFCLDTCRKRKLTERQRAKREEINARVLYYVHQSRE
jgi:hypothetical protein